MLALVVTEPDRPDLPQDGPAARWRVRWTSSRASARSRTFACDGDVNAVALGVVDGRPVLAVAGGDDPFPAGMPSPARQSLALPKWSRDGLAGHNVEDLGLSEQLVFPELNPDKFTRVQGMNITIVIKNGSDDESRELLTQLGMPFQTEEVKPAKK